MILNCLRKQVIWTQGEKGVLCESRSKRKHRNRKHTAGQRRGTRRMAEVCVKTGLTGRKTQTLPQWQDFGCQNSSGCSAIVKLSASKKMEEITHSPCLWEETVIAVDFWIKYDWTQDFKGGRNASEFVCLGALNRCLSLSLSVHLFFSPWLLFYAEPSPNQADVTCHELNMGAWSCVSLGGDRKALLTCH